MGRASRTGLFRIFRRAFRRSISPPLESRRAFLKQTAALSATALIGSCGGRDSATNGRPMPRIVIVGAGIAGLNAAWRLRQRGIPSTVYESSARAGGRMHSAKDLLVPGGVTELGGEFIDTGHEDMIALCREFRLDLVDVDEANRDLIEDTCYFDGRILPESDILEALKPIAPRLKADVESLGDAIDFENPGRAEALDRVSIAEYLDTLGVRGWFRSLLETAYVTEYGMEAGRQSSINLLWLAPSETGGRVEMFGESDERFKVAGGNARVCAELARRLDRDVHLERRLEAVRAHGEGYRLTFRGDQGKAVDVDADYVLLTLPFSTLRSVEIGVDLPPFKKKAIAELGYGNSSKLFAGVKERPWRAQGRRGDCFTDQAFQMAWENSLGQAGPGGGLTIFQGGDRVADLAKGTPESQVERLLPGVDRVFPGAKAAFNGKCSRFLWHQYPHALGGYACYTTGQWTTIAGAEFKPVGRLRFAGEHCSIEHQGFMNGGAETGRRAAEAIAAEVLR
jgi:monoamine oxidase